MTKLNIGDKFQITWEITGVETFMDEECVNFKAPMLDKEARIIYNKKKFLEGFKDGSIKKIQ